MAMTLKTLVARSEALGAQLGAAERMTLAQSEALYEAYKALSDDDKEIVKAKFTFRYFMAQTGLREKEAEVLYAAPRETQEAEGVRSAYRSAQMKFDYHYVDRGPKSGPNGGAPNPQNLQAALKGLPRGASTHITALATDYFDGDLKALLDAVKILKAAADAKAAKAKKVAA